MAKAGEHMWRGSEADGEDDSTLNSSPAPEGCSDVHTSRVCGPGGETEARRKRRGLQARQATLLSLFKDLQGPGHCWWLLLNPPFAGKGGLAFPADLCGSLGAALFPPALVMLIWPLLGRCGCG